MLFPKNPCLTRPTMEYSNSRMEQGMVTQSRKNFIALCTITATLFLSIFAAPRLQAGGVNVRIIGPASSYASHDAAAIATELNNILAGASGYAGSSSSVTVLSGATLTEAYYHPSCRTATRAALAESYTHLVILPETGWLVSYPEQTFDGVYQMSRKAFAKGSTPLLLMPGTGTASNITNLGTNAYRIGNGCGIHIIPGGYAAQSASLVDPSTTTTQARAAYLLAATIFTKITGLNASTGSTYVPSVSSYSTLASTAASTITTQNSTVHYSTTRENSGLIRYRPFTSAGNSVRYVWTGTSTETGINNTLPAIIQASGFTNSSYQVTRTTGWDDAITTSAATNLNANPGVYQWAYARAPFVTALGQNIIDLSQPNLLPIAYDQHYVPVVNNDSILDDIYNLTEGARSTCTSLGWVTIPVHLGAARLADLDPSIIFSSDSTHWTAPGYNMIAAMMFTSMLGREPTPPATVLANSQMLNGFNVGKQIIKQLAFLSETEAYTPDTPLAISAVPALQAVQSQAFSYSFTATGGTAPYLWTEESTIGLPTGLTLSSSGSLSGIATSGAGTWNLIVKVKDSTGAIRKIPVALTVALSGSGPGSLSIASTTGLTASGAVGGPFSPSSQTYTLSNVGTTSINWTVAKTQGWITLSATSGTLAAGGNTSVTVSINTAANSLAASSYTDTVTFTNTTNSNGNAIRSVALTVIPISSTLTWDADGTTTGQTDGAGAWLGTSQWWTGSINTNWSSGANAAFGNNGAGGAVTLASPTSVNALNFNAFTGTYTIGTAGQAITVTSAITVNASAGTTTIISPLSLANPVDWTNDSTNITTASSTITGSGNLTKLGTGPLVLAPSPDTSDYTGTTTVSEGVLNIQKATALGSVTSGTSVASGAALQIQGGISVGNEPLALDGSGISSTGALRNISGTNIYAGILTFNGPTRIQSDAGTLSLSHTGTITGAGAALSVGGAGNVSINGIIATTTGSLTKDGAGTLTLMGANTYSGGTVINGGNVTLGTTSTDSLGAADASIAVNANCTLTTTATTTLQKSIALNNNALLSFANPSGGMTITGAVTGAGSISAIGGGTNLAQRVTTLASDSNNFTGAISNPVGANFADVIANSLYEGVGAGNIIYGEAGQARTMRFAWGTGATAPLILANRQLVIYGTTPTAYLSNNNATAAYTVTVNTNLVNNSTVAANFVLGGANTGTNRFAGNITNGTGTLGLTKTDGGLWALSGTNTYTGTTVNGFSNPAGAGLIFQGMQALPPSTTLQQTHSGGTGGHSIIRLLDDSATPASRSGVNIAMIAGNTSQGMTLFVGNNSTANGGASSSTQTGSTIVLGNLNITQNAIGNSVQTLYATGANSYRLQINNVSPTLQAAATTYTATLSPSTAPITVVGNVQQAGNGSTGTLTLVLDGTASNNIISGTILNSADATPKVLKLTKSNTSTWILTGVNTYSGLTTVSTGILQLGDGTSGKDGTIENTSGITNNATLVFNRYGNLSSNVAISGTGAVTKSGPGTQTLTGNNSYTGTTTVSEGKLFINGNQTAAAGAVSVSSGATLGGTGVIGGNTTITTGGKLEFNLGTDAATHDSLDLATGKTLTFSSTSVITINSPGGSVLGTYTLVTAPGGIVGSVPATVNLPAGWVATVAKSGNSLVLNVTSGSNGSVGSLATTPVTGLTSAGNVGGAFSPNSVVYTLSNPGTTSFNWTASKTAGWLDLSATSGTLAAGANTTVTATINTAANSLVAGSYNDTITFTNTTNSNGNTTRSVGLTITPAPCTVSYAGNGNTGGTAPVNQLKTYNVGLTLSGAGTLVRTGYTFSGWNTAANGTGTSYAAAVTYSTNADLALYAQWNANPIVNAGTDQLVTLPVAWSPTNAGPLAWYDASDAATITQAGGAVSKWSDKVGTAHMVQATPSMQPITGSAPNQINGLNTIAFDGISHALKTVTNPFGGSISNAMLIGVFNVSSINTGTPTLFSLSGSGADANRWQSHAPWIEGTLYFDCGGINPPNRISAASGFAANQTKLLGYYCSTTDSVQQVWVDGTNLVSDASGHTVSAVGGIAFGSDGTASNFDNCRMGEVMVINGTVSATNRQKLEGYLANKWGLTASLPAGHPYKTLSPTTAIVVVNLTGTTSDPNGDTLTTTWSLVSGPGTVTFANANAVNTTATFTVAGTYTLRLTSTDPASSKTDDIVVTVNPYAGSATVDHFTISAIGATQTAGTPITGITITAKDVSNNTVTGFTGAVSFGGTGGFTGNSAAFTAGVLSGVSVTPTVAGSNLTFTVTDGSAHSGSATITTINPGTLHHFGISVIGSSQTVGTAITGITLTAQDASGNTATSFTSTVTFGGTGGFTGTSGTFTAGVLTGVSVTPTVAGSNLTFTVNDGSGHTGSATISSIQTQYAAWSSGTPFDADDNGDGVKNGLAFILGASNASAAITGLLPAISQSSGNLTVDFKYLHATKRGSAVLKLQFSKDLGATDLWTSHTIIVPVEIGTYTLNDVVFVVTQDSVNTNLNQVQVTIPASAASGGGKVFVRLMGEIP